MKAKKLIISLVIILLIFTLTQNVSANPSSSINMKKIKGYTEYEIGGNDYGFTSLLEFPLDHNFIGGTISFRKNYIYKLSLYTNLTEKAGKMKDSDWIYDYGDEGKDIYSESDSYLKKSYIFNFEVINRLKNNNINIRAKSGYKTQYFDYLIKDGIQYGGITSTGRYIPKDFVFELSGDLLEYTIYYEIPYLGFDFIHEKQKLFIKFAFDYSSYVKAYDRDDHLLRNKISYSETQGNYYNINSNLQYNIKKNVRITTSFNYLFIETRGLQKQYKYGGETKEFIGSVNNIIKTEQSSITLGMKIDF